MILTRREILGAGGGLPRRPLPAWPGRAGRRRGRDQDAGATLTDRMSGSTRSAFWSSPGRRSAGPTSIRATRIRRRPITRQISTGRCAFPTAAKPWNSDYLLPDETFSVTLTEKGVYDYYCVPHEHAGMVGRIVVGATASRDGWLDVAGATWRSAGSGAAGVPVGRGHRAQKASSGARRAPDLRGGGDADPCSWQLHIGPIDLAAV